MKQKIKILIADDHMIVRVGLAALLAHEKDMTVVGEADDGQQVLDCVDKLKPDVVVMDLMMPVIDGEAATAELKKRHPEVKVVILTSYSTADGIANAIQAGAAGALLKTTDDAILLSAIRTVASGQEFISSGISQLLASDPPARGPALDDARTHEQGDRAAARHRRGARRRARQRDLLED